MKNILVVLHMCPYPLTTGGNQAVINGIKALSKHNNVVLLFPSNRKNSNSKRIKELEKALSVEVETFTPKIFNSKVTAYKYLSDKIMFYLLHKNKDYMIEREMNLCNNIITDEFINYIYNIIDNKHIDVVQIEFVPFLSLVNALEGKNVTKVFVHHELRFIRNKLILSKIRHAKNYFTYLFEKLKNEEISLLNKFDAIITLSEIDAKKLKQNGVIIPIFPSFAIVSSHTQSWVYAKYRLTFLGPGMHNPNFQGLKWFIDNVWERITKTDDKYSLDIIGKWSKEQIEELGCHDKINYLGFVDNLGDVLKGSIMIVPITIGSGIRMKILEAAQYKIPIITTTIGCEGLPLKDNENCFIADTPVDFANKIFEIGKRDLQERLVNNAYKTIIKNYSLNALIVSRDKILESI